jgi:hypothetical protein
VALEQFKCDARLLVLDQARWSANPLAVLWSETAWRAEHILAEAALVGRMTPLLQNGEFRLKGAL